MPQGYEGGRIRGTNTGNPLIDQIGRGYRPNEPSGRERMVRDMQVEARGGRPTDADVNEDFARRLLEGGADAQAGKVRAIRAQGRGGMRVPYGANDDDFMYHRTNERNLRGFQEQGNDPGLKRRGSFGTHFAPSSEGTWGYADQANAEGGDSIMLRTRRSPEMTMHDPQDYSTQRRIAPADWEVLGEGATPEMPGRWTGLGNAYSKGATGLGLYNMLAAFLPGKLPSFQGPTDMVLADLMRQAYGPGGAMDPYRDYQGPRDPQTGDILA